MQPVFPSLRQYDADAANYAMSSEILMENAARGMTEFITHLIKKKFQGKKPLVQIVCGSADNGADGLAAARMLCDAARVRVVQAVPPKSTLCRLQMQRLELLGIPCYKTIIDCDILLDAFLGTGLQSQLRESAVRIIKKMNAVQGIKIACDIPSGLCATAADLKNLGMPLPIAVKSDYTLSAGALKLALYTDDAKDYVGKIKLISLGLPQSKYSGMDSDFFVLQDSDMKLPVRHLKNTHKGMFGHCAVTCGEKTGAAVLAGKAALNFGAGLVTLCGEKPDCLPPDLMYSTELIAATAYCAGPGAGSKADVFTASLIQHAVSKATAGGKKEADGKSAEKKAVPIVFDADALKPLCLAQNLDKLPCVITPHPKEFMQLLQNLIAYHKLEDIDAGQLTVQNIQNNRFYYAKLFSAAFPHTVLVLKGANQIIAYNQKLYICTAGMPSLSKAGSGDVLAGLITALLAQGYSGVQACITASLALGKASRTKHLYSSTASKLIKRIAGLGERE